MVEMTDLGEFSHTLKRWPRSGMVPFPGFFRRGDPFG
jgi:hypothetical protein